MSNELLTSQTPEAQEQSTSLSLAKLAPELILVIFIHGFKGTDETFAGFPGRLQHILSETIPNASVECIVFPAYETKGDLNEAVVRFADWLTTLTVEREVASGGGSGSAKIALCGHSMGGLLAADTLLEFMNSRPDKECPLWPRIIACIAFDTPFLGLHPSVIKNSATRATEYADVAKTVGSAVFGSLAGLGMKKAASPVTPIAESSGSAWSRFTSPAAYVVGGAILAGAAAGGAYYKREDLGAGYAWATDHMKYVRNLWDEDALHRRVDSLVKTEEQEGVVFRTFYTVLPPSLPTNYSSRTFIVLPKSNSSTFSHFLPARNGLAPDELQAHTGMFKGNTNDGYYELGLATAKIIRESVLHGRNVIE